MQPRAQEKEKKKIPQYNKSVMSFVSKTAVNPVLQWWVKERFDLQLVKILKQTVSNLN